MFKIWIIMVLAVSTAAYAVTAFVPPVASMAKAPVHECGENAGWIVVSPGITACTLKNGTVVNLRSAQ